MFKVDNNLSVQLASSDHDELQKNEDGAHDLAVVELAGGAELVAEKELEDKEEAYDEEAPDGSQQGVLEVSVQVLPDEHDDTEVSVEAVRDEQGSEHVEPVVLFLQDNLLTLEVQKDGEEGESEKE